MFLNEFRVVVEVVVFPLYFLGPENRQKRSSFCVLSSKEQWLKTFFVVVF